MNTTTTKTAAHDHYSGHRKRPEQSTWWWNCRRPNQRRHAMLIIVRKNGPLGEKKEWPGLRSITRPHRIRDGRAVPLGGRVPLSAAGILLKC
jgi:hypothetical protein